MDRIRFQDALEKGHGRALQHTRAIGRLVDEDLVLQACWANLACDKDIEGARASWMLQIVDAGDAFERIASRFLARVCDDLDGRSEGHRSQFLMALVERGFPGARKAVDDLLAQVSSPFALLEGLARLEGERGFLLGTHIYADAAGESAAVGVYVVEPGDRVFGRGSTLDLLRRSAQSDSRIHALVEKYDTGLTEIAQFKARSAERDALRPQSGDEAVALVRGTGRIGWPRWLEQWASSVASASDLDAVFRAAQTEIDKGTLRKLLRGLAWADHAPAFAWFSDMALKQGPEEAKHILQELVRFSPSRQQREFIERWLVSRDLDHFVFMMFSKNQRPGDAAMLLDIVQNKVCANEADRRYEMYWDYHHLMDIYDACPTDAAMIPPFVYEEASCAYARFKAVDAMLKTGTLPVPWASECGDDSFADTRERGQQTPKP